MQKGLTEVVFILDRSGSINGLEADTIGGFNAMIEKQKKEEGEAYITTVLFDDQVEFGYSDLVKESARLLREKYLHINPEITFKDILTDPRELVEAVGN